MVENLDSENVMSMSANYRNMSAKDKLIIKSVIVYLALIALGFAVSVWYYIPK